MHLNGSPSRESVCSAARHTVASLSHPLCQVVLTTEARLTWVGFATTGMLCTADSAGLLRGLAEKVFDGMMRGHSAHLIEALQHLRASGIPIPKNYRAAIKGDFAEYWKQCVWASSS